MKQLFILMFFAFWGQARAQAPDYYVYLVAGDATITKPGAKPIAMKQNQLVYKSDVIALKKGAELTLVDKNAGFLVLNTAGNYKSGDLIKKGAKKNSDGVTGKYLKLLFHELLDPDHDFEKFKKENIAGVSGGVTRSDDCGNRIFPINGLKTSPVSIVFRWTRTSPSSTYLLEIYDGEGNELLKMNVKDTMQQVNINEKLHGKLGKYFWRVTSEDGGCEDDIPIYFEVLKPGKEKEQSEQLISTTGSESLAMQLQQIDKLEKNGFIHAASGRYATAVKANPENNALRKSYVLFLLKYGFEEEAASAWK